MTVRKEILIQKFNHQCKVPCLKILGTFNKVINILRIGEISIINIKYSITHRRF